MVDIRKREEPGQDPASPTQSKHTIRFGKLLLLAGLGLAALVVLEAQQQVVGALDLGKLPIAPSSLRLASPPASEAPTNETKSSPAATPSSKEASPQSSTLAINIGDSGSQPTVAAVDPRQMRLPQWQGSSFPVENFQAYTSPFGYRMSPSGSYSQEFHYGLDIAAPEGSYIRNWWGGKVVEVSDDSNCGTSVVVESGSWLHIYCHMQGHVEVADGRRYMIDRSGGVQIWEGQDVPAGTRIGRVGMTGRTTGPHLHWGMKYNSNWVDPALVLRAMYSEQQNATR